MNTKRIQFKHLFLISFMLLVLAIGKLAIAEIDSDNHIALTPRSNIFAYLINDDLTSTVCTVNFDGSLKCNLRPTALHYIANLAFNTAKDGNTYGYLLKYLANSSISLCTVSIFGKLECRDEQKIHSLQYPSSIAFYTNMNGNTYAYVTDSSQAGRVSLYKVKDDGQLVYRKDYKFNGPTRISFHRAADGQTRAYIIVNQSVRTSTIYNGSHIEMCNIKNSDGELIMPCDSAGNISQYTLWDMAFNTTTDGKAYAYFTDGHVLFCQVGYDGKLSDCSKTKSGFDNDDAHGIAFNINSNGTNYAYMTNFDDSTVSYCQVRSNGQLALCKQAADSRYLSGPGPIIFYHQ